MVGYSYHVQQPVPSRVRGPHPDWRKGQITIPKQYRDELGLNTGSPVAVLRIGAGLMLIPEQNRFRLLCDSIASVLERRRLSAPDLLDTLPEARQRIFV